MTFVSPPPFRYSASPSWSASALSLHYQPGCRPEGLMCSGHFVLLYLPCASYVKSSVGCIVICMLSIAWHHPNPDEPQSKSSDYSFYRKCIEILKECNHTWKDALPMPPFPPPKEKKNRTDTKVRKHVPLRLADGPVGQWSLNSMKISVVCHHREFNIETEMENYTKFSILVCCLMIASTIYPSESVLEKVFDDLENGIPGKLTHFSFILAFVFL